MIYKLNLDILDQVYFENMIICSLYFTVTLCFHTDGFYRVSNKFSDTLNELFVVNWLISHFFCDNTKWKVVTSPHYLKILLKSTKHGLSYNLKRDWKSISKITFVGGFVLALVIQNLKNFSQKQHFLIQICIIFEN